MKKYIKRKHKRWRTSWQFGKSRLTILCPFCNCETVAFIWSWAGHGIKPCDHCPAQHLFLEYITKIKL